MKENNNKFFIGKVSEYAKGKGWFFGHFADEPLLKSDIVEVALENISNKLPEPGDKHLHKVSVEINLVVSGEVSFDINGEHAQIKSGEFYVVWPGAIIENVSAIDDTRVVVIKTPSVNDKVPLA